jgi:hypothetical protein
MRQFRDHSQVRNLSRRPAKLENTNETNENDQVADTIRRFAKSHASDEHEWKGDDNANRSCAVVIVLVTL